MNWESKRNNFLIRTIFCYANGAMHVFTVGCYGTESVHYGSGLQTV